MHGALRQAAKNANQAKPGPNVQKKSKVLTTGSHDWQETQTDQRYETGEKEKPESIGAAGLAAAQKQYDRQTK